MYRNNRTCVHYRTIESGNQLPDVFVTNRLGAPRSDGRSRRIPPSRGRGGARWQAERPVAITRATHRAASVASACQSPRRLVAAPKMGARMLCAVLLCATIGFAHGEEDTSPDDGDSDTVNILWPLYLSGLAFSAAGMYYVHWKRRGAQTDISTVIWPAGPTTIVQLPPGRLSAQATH